MEVKFSQAVSMATTALKCKLVPMLIGSPGCGKSSVAYLLAEMFNLKLIDFRLSQCDPTDLLGFPHVFGKKAGYIPMETFPLEGDPIPEGYTGWLLFLDELNSASEAVQAAAYKVILDRMVGQQKLHKNVAIMGAGNKETDNAIVQPMSTALQSRLIHFELMLDHEEWLTWAVSKNISHQIIDYIDFMPDQLFTFKPDHTDNTYACPRTWEFANRLLNAEPEDSPNLVGLLSGALSEGVARQFLSHRELYQSLPAINTIKTNPGAVPVPSDPSVLYALSGSISSHAKDDTSLPNLLNYARRLPVEFQVVTGRQIVRKKPELESHKEVSKWRREFAAAYC